MLTLARGDLNYEMESRLFMLRFQKQSLGRRPMEDKTRHEPRMSVPGSMLIPPVRPLAPCPIWRNACDPCIDYCQAVSSPGESWRRKGDKENTMPFLWGLVGIVLPLLSPSPFPRHV